jgi:hypothetical protein
VADQGAREVDQAIGEPAMGHQIAGEQEHRDGEEGEGARAAVEHLDQHDQGRFAPEDEIVQQPGRAHGEKDRRAQHDEREQDDDHPADDHGAPPPEPYVSDRTGLPEAAEA